MDSVPDGALLPLYLRNAPSGAPATTRENSTGVPPPLSTAPLGRKETCYLCNQHTNKPKHNKRFSNITTTLYNHRNLNSKYNPVPFYLTILPVDRKDNALSKRKTIIPFTAYMNDLKTDDVSYLCSPLSIGKPLQPYFDPYFATIDISTYVSRLAAEENNTSSNYPAIEIANHKFLLFEIYNDKGERLSRWTEKIQIQTFPNERIHCRSSRYKLTTWRLSPVPTLQKEMYHLKNETEICILNYKSRYFLINSIRLVFTTRSTHHNAPHQSPLCVGPWGRLFLNEHRRLTPPLLVHDISCWSQSSAQITNIGCTNCVEINSNIETDRILKRDILQKQENYGVVPEFPASKETHAEQTHI